MQVTAKAKYIRMSPRKVRLVVSIIRGKTVDEAIDQLKFTNKIAVKPIEKLIKSAVASAKHNNEIEQDNLRIAEIRVDEGPTLHRWKPRAYGRATPIRKRTSHISLVLSEIKETTKKKTKKTKLEAPIKMDKRPTEDEGIEAKKDKKKTEEEKKAKEEEPVKKIIDQRAEGRGKHTKIEGKSQKGFMGKIFRRKSG
jgi:large subunit ribosomal protein L22